MAIPIKSNEQIQKMKIAGRIVANAHEIVKNAIRPGITTKELDQLAEDYIRSQGATPSFKGYHGFPASICASVNEEVVHGIPSARKIQDGDIISIDIGAFIHGYHGDGAKTHGVGTIQEEANKLIQITRQSFYEGIRYARAGCHLHEIGGSIQAFVESHGFSVVRDFVGHGVGRQMHEEPQIPNYRLKSRGPRLEKGMVLAIEPMVNMGTYEIRVLKDRWTVVTKDGKNSSHYEHTVLITDGEPELLTLL